MCQLTLIKVPNLTMLRALLANQMLVNTRHTHRDGAGISYISNSGKDFLLTSKLAPILNEDFYEEFIAELDTAKYPVLAHVRKASTLKNNVKEDHVHPFYDKETDLTIAHNGTLYFLDEEREAGIADEFPDMIDSQIFFSVLIEEFKKTDKDVVKALEETMKQFYGKFAFLLQHGKDFYAIRGSTADLHVGTIYEVGETLEDSKAIGVVVNTEIAPLKDNFGFTLTALRTPKVKYAYKIEELEKETIYKLNGVTLEKIGELKQNDAPKKAIVQTQSSHAGFLPVSDARMQNTVSRTQDGLASTGDAVLRALVNIGARLALSFEELDELFYLALNIPLCQVTSTDIRDFSRWVAPIFEEYIEGLGDSYREKRLIWNEVLKANQSMHRTSLYLLKSNYITFPWYLEETETLQKFADTFKKEEK